MHGVRWAGRRFSGGDGRRSTCWLVAGVRGRQGAGVQGHLIAYTAQTDSKPRAAASLASLAAIAALVQAGVAQAGVAYASPRHAIHPEF